MAQRVRLSRPVPRIVARERMRSQLTAEYIRVSSEAQAKKYGPDSQRQDIVDACERYGLERPAIAYEDHISAKGEITRTDFVRMLADAARGRFKILLVGRVDRFARNEQQAWNYVDQLIKAGIWVFYCDEDVAAGLDERWQDAVTSKFSLAAAVSRQISENVRKANRLRRSRGMFVGKIPWGWCPGENGKLALDPVSNPAVKRAGELVIENKKNLREIAAQLTSEGFQGMNGGPISKRLVHLALTNPLLYGSGRALVAYAEESHQVENCAPETFTKRKAERIKAILNNRYRRKRDVARQKHTYIFQDLLRCGEERSGATCGEQFHGVYSAKTTGYAYVGYKHPRAAATPDAS